MRAGSTSGKTQSSFGNSLSQISADKEFPLLASLKQLDERRYKITVSNGYRPDGRKVCKARTLHVPKKIPRRSVLQYVMHAAEELEKEFKYGYAEDGEKTFEAYARGWLERQTHYAPSTLAGYRQMLERVYGEIGQIRLKELRPITIEYLLERLRKQPGPSGRKLGEATVQKYWGVVSVVLNDAKRNQIIAYNPAQCIGKPEAKYREQKIPTDKEAKRFLGLLEQAPVLYRSYFTLMMLTGMRRGELCALRWKDIRRECIVVSRSRGRVRGAGLLEGPTKNGKPRLIAVSRTMSGVLDALRQWHLETQGEIIEDALLFVNENGSSPDPATFTHWLRRFYDRNGFSREFHVHTLRHYAITTMLAEGISKQTVAEIAGHASTDFLERTYCHPQMESRMLAAERLSNVLFPS